MGRFSVVVRNFFGFLVVVFIGYLLRRLDGGDRKWGI